MGPAEGAETMRIGKKELGAKGLERPSFTHQKPWGQQEQTSIAELGRDGLVAWLQTGPSHANHSRDSNAHERGSFQGL